MNILVIKLRNIGDVLLTTPLFTNLRNYYPYAKIDALVNSGTEEMLTLNPDIDEVLIYPRETIRKEKFLKRLYHEIAFANRVKQTKYDIVINLTKGDRGLFLAYYLGAKRIVGYRVKNALLNAKITDFLPPLNNRHTVETNLDAIKALGHSVVDRAVRIYTSDETKRAIDGLELPKSFVHIHPVSRWMFKSIADETMAEVIDFCKNELGLDVVITSAPIDKELEKVCHILNFVKSEGVINLAGKLSLKESAELNRRAKFFIGVDTAIMHISAANSVPVVAFFGPSSSYYWGPWDNECLNSGYRVKSGFVRMGRHCVIQKSWECVPCFKDGCFGSKVSDCLMSFDGEKIKRIIKESLAKI